jgi:SAM-dependent methyltransferase
MVMAMSEAAYDRIGVGYRQVRQPDPRIAAHLEAALGDARSVLNVGAGTGSYEPAEREVTAVEPSRVMIKQRPPGAAPVVQGSAEKLPFGDDSFDAAMAIITVHHWRDPAAGLAEMWRVARGPVVALSFDPEPFEDNWLGNYFPAALRYHREAMPPIAELAALLGPEAAIVPVPIPRQCSDGFFCAIWDRPELHLDAAVRRASSVWHLIDPAEVERDLAALRADLESGAWDERYGELRQLPELDVGLRLLSSG